MLKNKNLPSFGPLKGVKVISAVISLAGPYAGNLMADFGADVIKLENPMMPDLARGSALAYQELRNQRCLALNTPTPEGKEIFGRLLKEADVFLETSKGGQYANWGLTDEWMHSMNPKLVIGHLSGFGQSGLPDYVERASFDPIAQAFSGFMNINGFPDRKPISVMPNIADYFSGYLLLSAMLASLYRVKKGGQGEVIDLAQYEAMSRVQSTLVDYMTDGLVTKRQGLKSPLGAGVGLYECKEGQLYCFIVAGGVLKKFLPVIGLQYGSDMFPNGSAVMGFNTTGGGEEAEKRFTAWLKERTADQAAKELIAAGVPVTKVNEFSDLLKDPHIKARGVIQEWKSGEGRTIKGVGIVPKLTKNPGKIWMGLRTVGKDNDEILGELGFSAAEIKSFYDKKIIGQIDLEAASLDKLQPIKK